MKKLLAMATLIAAPALAQAQEVHLYGGYNASSVSKSGQEHWQGKAGYQFGADLMIGNRWFLKPGVEFLVRNLHYTYLTGPEASAQFQYTNHSLRVPIMLGVQLLDPSEEPAVNGYLMAGPSAIMKLNADLNNNALDVETTGTQWQLGVGAGLEVSFLFVEAGYDIGMSNVFSGDDFETNPKMNFLHVNAGLRLRLAH
jgi:hypothetical protein